jgi:hypothetical protein
VVEGAHVDVVHVEQQEAVGASRDLRQAQPLGNLRIAIGEVARGVLERERPAVRPVDDRRT